MSRTLDDVRRDWLDALRGRPSPRDEIEAAILGMVWDGTWDRLRVLDREARDLLASDDTARLGDPEPDPAPTEAEGDPDAGGGLP